VLGVRLFFPVSACGRATASSKVGICFRGSRADGAFSGNLAPSSADQIYEFDRAPLGNRIPVLLVPGRAEEFQHDSWWKRFNQVANQNYFFKSNFKLYVFLYNSKEELDVQATSLAKDIRKRFGHLPKTQPLMVVAYSLGGVMIREVFKDIDMLDRVDTVFAIATPFHGSPIFDPAWFSEYLNPPHRSPLRRFWDRTFYRLYMFDKSNLTRGMAWDNFDGSKPQFHVDNTPHIIGDQVNAVIPEFQEYPNADEIRKKMIIYASYMENELTRKPGEMPKVPQYGVTSGPAFLLGTVLPIYGFTVHSVFTYTNYQLANLATYTVEDPQGRNTHLYRYNDGAIPMSSMLFLKPRREAYSEDLLDLAALATVKKVRIIADLDHVDMGEYNLRKSHLIRPDLLHPDEGIRSPNEWVIYDLNQRFRELCPSLSRCEQPEENLQPAP
jgi:hypothetical protein